MAKSIPLAEVALVKKLMALTFSDNDNEALAALRKANAILKKHSLTWEDVLSRTVEVGRASGGADESIDVGGRPPTLSEQIEHALNALRGVVSPGFQRWLDSVEEQYRASKERGTPYLSPAQRAPLFDAYRKHVEKARA